MKLSKDYEILRQLGRVVQEHSYKTATRQQEKLTNWKALNSLQSSRPLFMIDQLPWNEMMGIDELKLRCQDPELQQIESHLRCTIFKFTHFEDDLVILPEIRIPKHANITNFGLQSEVEFSDNPIAEAGGASVHGQAFTDQLKCEDDLAKIGIPTVEPLDALNKQREEMYNEIFHGILEVKMGGFLPNFHAWDQIVEWHGVTESVLDLIDRPEFMHKIIARTLESRLALLDQLEEHNLLDVGNPIIHCTGAYTDELPGYDYKNGAPLNCASLPSQGPAHRRKPEDTDPPEGSAKNMWTYGAAQIFSTVSPAMHNEFDIQYAKKWYERFGLGYYGCCEPLDTKVDIIRELLNVRKISMSPWANVERAAEAIHGDYIISSKPSPAYFATSDTLDTATIRTDFESAMKSATKHGCNIEFILKDVSTIQKDVKKLKEWAKLAASICGRPA